VLGRVHRFALQVFRRLPVSARRRVVRTIAPSFTVGAICVIERSDGAVLLVRQSYRNSWGLPGGLLKRGETPVAAAIREVREESTLEIDVMDDPATVVDAAAQRVDIVFRARPAPGVDPASARPGSPEILEVGWFPSGDLPDLQFETSGALVALARRAVAPSAD
jgi:ADP-ribose pyrophosphatase YjhB (NUDIX family)